MPDAARFASVLRAYQRRLRLLAIADALLWAAAATGVTIGATWWWRLPSGNARVVSLTTFVVATAATAVWWANRWTSSRVAAAIEARSANPHNLVVTAEEIAAGRCKSPHPLIREELFQAAERQLQVLPAPLLFPVWRSLSLALIAAAAVVALVVAVPSAPARVSDRSFRATSSQPPALAVGDLRVVVTPPAYVRQPRTESVNPTTVVAWEGSRIRFEMSRAHELVVLLDVRGEPSQFASDASTRFYEFDATASQPFVVRVEDATRSSDRLVHLRVQIDDRPTVRIVRPAQDLVFPAPAGEVPIAIEASDDVGLTSLALRYTRVSGSGETFTFEEGDWPLQVTRGEGGQWTGRATLALEQLQLQDGDTLVYRAVARDAKPGAEPSASETFFVEIGRLSGVAATGFAVPEERDRQGLSQQMLIVKTERLHGQRQALTSSDSLEQSRLLAIEQRMVKAEFVFMTGGEVADEVEEAEHAHELAEGRLENAAQVELLTAIREMSRAEARLNDGDTGAALEFERAALRALQRAFDRRRYLLRALPERSRIDLSRRLSGDVGAARSSSPGSAASPGDAERGRARELLRALTQGDLSGANASLLASRLIAVDPSSEALQKAAVQLSVARDEPSRRAAARHAVETLLERLRQRLGVSAPIDVAYDPVLGRLVEELTRPERGR